MSKRANALADRVQQGSQALAALAEDLSDSEWQTIVPNEERPVGVLVHHVASSYPIEIDLARSLASAKPIEGVTWQAVDQITPSMHRRMQL